MSAIKFRKGFFEVYDTDSPAGEVSCETFISCSEVGIIKKFAFMSYMYFLFMALYCTCNVENRNEMIFNNAFLPGHQLSQRYM